MAIALAAFIFATALSYHQLTGRGLLASDFQYALRAALRLLAGGDPYDDPTTRYGLPYPFDARFPYPLNAALLAVPFTGLDPYFAGAVFVGIGSALMAFAVTRDSLWRLSFFLSPSYFVAASVANWSPIIVASAFLPSLYPLAIAKPHIALPVFITRPNARGYLLCLAMLALTLLVMPDWPVRWVRSLADQVPGKYAMPLAVPLVVPVAIALLWWRYAPARFLLMMAVTPQHPFFYDQLLLWLIPATLRQSLTLSAVTWLGYLSWSWWDGGDVFLAYTPHGPSLEFTAPWYYLPALGLVAWQVRFEPLSRAIRAFQQRRGARDHPA